jgi:aldehyde dehydrogenase (NAD+)
MTAVAPSFDREEVLGTGLLIGEEWVRRTSVGELEHRYAGTGQSQRRFPVAGRVEVDAAVRAARAALPGWRQWVPTDRRNVLLRLAALMREHADEFALISTLEAGMLASRAKPLAPRAAEWIEYYAGWIDKVEGAVVPVGSALDYTLREPIGVVGLILPSSGPTGALGRKVGPALAAACTVVIKPSEVAPFSPTLFGRLCLAAGIPSGVVNIVPGGADAGEALAEHADVDKISFTGGPAVGRYIQAACARSLTPLTLELGGKSANIVFADADLDAAAGHATDGIVAGAGQACIAPTRLLLHDSVYDEVLGRVMERLASVQVGDPFDPETTMGPVISEKACRHITDMVDQAVGSRSGSLLLGGGERPTRVPAGGYYVQPTVFGDVDPGSDLAQSEVFGPVLTAMRFRDDDEAVEIANSTRFGLAAYVHTRDLTRALTLAGRLEAGNVSVNGGAAVAGPAAPFGGFKESGFGVEGGLAGLMEFIRTKNVNIRLDRK